MPMFMDVHQHLPDGTTASDVAGAHAAGALPAAASAAGMVPSRVNCVTAPVAICST